jgi:MFS transporter, MHS family, shikimate and dehydroshikimate transport protein
MTLAERTTTPSPPRSEAVRVAVASLIGTSVEWYDFFLYGTAAALVFNRLFFPQLDPLTGTVAAFATFAVGFIARPIGGIIFGHYGDRIGRKKMLYITLLIMGLATAFIGLLPTYDRVGIWAPILLVVLRLAQGFGLGGEWGGAVLMAVEHAPANRRGSRRWCSATSRRCPKRRSSAGAGACPSCSASSSSASASTSG